MSYTKTHTYIEIKYDPLNRRPRGTYQSIEEKGQVVIYLTCPTCNHRHRLIDSRKAFHSDGRSQEPFTCINCHYTEVIKLMGYDNPERLNLYIWAIQQMAVLEMQYIGGLGGRRQRTKWRHR